MTIRSAAIRVLRLIRAGIRRPAAGLLALGLALGSFAMPLAAHEGHDHGEAPKAAALPVLAPRFEAASELFEVVGVVGSDGLTLWLDRFADNRPVAGAKLEIDGAARGVATEIAPAVYRLPASLKPGKHELTLTVAAGDDADLLAATLLLPAPEAAAPAVAASGSLPSPARLVAGAALLLALAAIGWRTLRRRAG